LLKVYFFYVLWILLAAYVTEVINPACRGESREKVRGGGALIFF